MRQVNVRDETHQLVRELSLKADKSILDVVQDALLLYQDKLEEKSDDDKLIGRLLREAVSVIVEGVHAKIIVIVPEAVEVVAEKLRKERERVENEKLRELQQALVEAEAEAQRVDDEG